MITAMPRIAIAVHDYEAAVDAFRGVFGMPVFDFSHMTVPDLGAHVGMCAPEGGSNIELMAPATPDAPLAQALQKFLDRRGDGLYALMLEAPVPNDEAEELLTRGVEVLPLMPGAGGRDIHPRSTHGVLVRVYPNDSAVTGDEEVSTTPHLSGIVRAVLATKDANAAAETYRVGLDLEVDAPVNDDSRGVTAAICRPPKGGVIELVSAVDTAQTFASDIDHFVSETGGGLHTLVLQADDADAAVATLTDRGATFGGETGRETTFFNTRFLIEDAPLS